MPLFRSSLLYSFFAAPLSSEYYFIFRPTLLWNFSDDYNRCITQRSDVGSSSRITSNYS